MKSLKSRLRRQDAPGPAPSGSGAAASAVSPVARERPAHLPRAAECSSALCFPWPTPATSPASGRGSASARRPWGPSPPLPRRLSRASTGPCSAPHPQVSGPLEETPAPPPSGVSAFYPPRQALPRRPPSVPPPGASSPLPTRAPSGLAPGAPPGLRAGRGTRAPQSRWTGQWTRRHPAWTPDLLWVRDPEAGWTSLCHWGSFPRR